MDFDEFRDVSVSLCQKRMASTASFLLQIQSSAVYFSVLPIHFCESVIEYEKGRRFHTILFRRFAMDIDAKNNEQKLFCRKCGTPILHDSLFCHNCGAQVLSFHTPSAEAPEHEETQVLSPEYVSINAENTYGATSSSNQGSESNNIKKAKKPERASKIVLSLLLVVLFACIAFFVFLKRPVNILPQDINTITGCPEFYNIQFGMGARQAAAQIDLETYVTVGHMNDSDPENSQDSTLFLEEDATFELYGIPADVFCYFDINKLESVLFLFSKDKTSLEEMTDLYTQIYGPSTRTNLFSSVWEGENTTIHILDAQENGFENDGILVYYMSPLNKQYENLTFDGPAHDPCNFLCSDVFNKKPGYYTEKLSDDDYDVFEYDSYTRYLLYPKFNFMGIESGSTAITLEVDKTNPYIGLCGYEFLLDENSAADRITYIKSLLEKEFGQFSSCDYTPLTYDQLDILPLSFEELIAEIKNGTEGIYYIQWETDPMLISLRLTIDSLNTSYFGAVSYAPWLP